MRRETSSPSLPKGKGHDDWPFSFFMLRLLRSSQQRQIHFGIGEAIIESYVQDRRTPRAYANKEEPPKVASPASVNRGPATLRRLLGLAYEWHLIDRIPVIKKLPARATATLL